MSKFLKIEFTMIVLGLAMGFAFFFVPSVIPAWFPVGTIADEPTEMFIEGMSSVHVKTSDNLVFLCGLSAGGCVPLKPDSVQLSHYRSLEPYCKELNPGIPWVLGTVVASDAIRVCGPEDTIDIYAVALDDGRILMWKVSALGRGVMAFLAMLVGCVGGPVLGWLVFIVSYLIKRRSQGKAKNDFKSTM